MGRAAAPLAGSRILLHRCYPIARILANLLIFLVPFVTLMLGSFGVIAHSTALVDGRIPFAAIVLMELFVNYCLLLAVALVSESQGWSVCAIVGATCSSTASFTSSF